jgi:hypothetical protein
MSDEVEVIRPLDADEIKQAIVLTIAQAIGDSLDRTCNLYGIAYPKFKAKWSVEMTLSRTPGPEQEFEDAVEESIHGNLLTQEFEPGTANPRMTKTPIHESQAQTSTVNGEIPYEPPNVVRKKHGLPVPTMVRRDDGYTEQKAVVYKRREGFEQVTREQE